MSPVTTFVVILFCLCWFRSCWHGQTLVLLCNNYFWNPSKLKCSGRLTIFSWVLMTICWIYVLGLFLSFEMVHDFQIDASSFCFIKQNICIYIACLWLNWYVICVRININRIFFCFFKAYLGRIYLLLLLLISTLYQTHGNLSITHSTVVLGVWQVSTSISKDLWCCLHLTCCSWDSALRFI